ncbi:Uncharacterized membrane protein YebE, DUF533 family [Alteromonadaceae bacterium Bs31]|nr:Uncharacterized membrane protein YebE, DUF533 family [Alteromonadaceae bacterium Bs31]
MNIGKMVSGLSSSGVLGGVAGGLVSGALMNNKSIRKGAGAALKLGGVAALGGLAWNAYSKYQASSQSQGASTAAGPIKQQWRDLKEQNFHIREADSDVHSKNLLIVQAMIAAACSDGHLDGDERARVFTKVEQLNLDRDEKALVFDSLNSPLSLDQLCARVDCSETAIDVYLASYLAVDSGATDAKFYLEALAYRLNLPRSLVEQIETEVHVGRPALTQSA